MKYNTEQLLSIIQQARPDIDIKKNIYFKHKLEIGIITHKDRIQLLKDIQKAIPTSKYIETSTGSKSVVVDVYKIVAWPARQRKDVIIPSNSKQNETILVDAINNITMTGSIKLTFKEQHSNKDFVINNVIGAEYVGTNTSDRKKADVLLLTKERKIPLSLKMDTASIWESADVYYRSKASAILKKIANGTISNVDIIQKQNGAFWISPEIAVRATTQEAENVIFGSDIRPYGAIITKTFTPESFYLHEEMLTITVNDIIKNIDDVSKDVYPYFVIRNDETRKSFVGFPGLRVVAIYHKKLTSKTVKLDYVPTN